MPCIRFAGITVVTLTRRSVIVMYSNTDTLLNIGLPQ